MERLSLSDGAVFELEHCNKCGFCLPACPTYQETGSEVASPRGRLSLVEAAWRGEIETGQGLADALSLCLGCRACESACPSGVRYGRVLEEARAALYHRRPTYTIRHETVPMLLDLVRQRRRFRRLVRLGQWGRSLPMPRRFKAAAALLPGPRPQLAPKPPPPAPSAPRPRIWFFTTCVMDTAYREANDAAVALLRAAGAEVIVEPDQGCCGALHAHSGREEEARAMARANLARWRNLPDDTWIVLHAGGCGAMLAEYDYLLRDDPEWGPVAARWAGRVKDFATALAALPRRPVYAGKGERVALQNSCHLVNGLRQGGAPVEILQNVPGDTFVPLPGQDRCCGSAGVYNLNEPGMAQRILARHVDEVRTERVDLWIVNNPGCGLQCEAGVRQAQLPTRVWHLAEYLYDRWTGEVTEAAR
jgi:glycolate oxidase iron-sulfur subunit